jgi:LysM repeat protein
LRQVVPRRGRRVWNGWRGPVTAALAAVALSACAGNAKVTEDATPPDPASATTGAPGATTPALAPLPLEVPMYTVVQGDTVGKIATKLGVDAQSVIDANGLANANKIQIGQKLRIPAGGKAADGTVVGIAPPSTAPAAKSAGGKTATTRKP